MTADDALNILRRAAEAPHLRGDLLPRLTASGYSQRRLRVMGRAMLRDGLKIREVGEYVGDLSDEIRTVERRKVCVEGLWLDWDVAYAWRTRSRSAKPLPLPSCNCELCSIIDDYPGAVDLPTVRVVDVSLEHHELDNDPVCAGVRDTMKM